MTRAVTTPSLQVPGASYSWDEAWAVPPADALAGAGWAHHGLTVTADQRIVGAQSGGDAICLFERDGTPAGSWPSGLVEPHGMALTGGAGDERLWIADAGFAMVPDRAGGYELHRPSPDGRVVCFDLAGERIGELPVPPPAGSALGEGVLGGYAPTGVDVDERDGSLWVADGYGQGLVHRFTRDGELSLTLTGEEGAGRFDCPHAVLVDRRGARPRVYVADRGNARLQVYDDRGRFLHTVEDGLRSPTALIVWGERLVVAELHARLTVLDADDRLVGHLGRDDEAPARAGWPNAETSDGRTVRPPLAPGRFNSPHGLAVDERGDLYVAEWVIGGRWIRLRREETPS